MLQNNIYISNYVPSMTKKVSKLIIKQLNRNGSWNTAFFMRILRLLLALYFIITYTNAEFMFIWKSTVCLSQSSDSLKVLAHLTTIRWKTLDCSQARRLRQQIDNYFRKHQGRLFGRNFVDDCLLFWFAAVSAVCKQWILLTICSTVYLLLIHTCTEAK